MKKITLLKEELLEILEVLEKFPDVEKIEVGYDGSSGIGYLLEISFPYIVNEVATTQTIEISGVDTW
jgi:hypothetical protein